MAANEVPIEYKDMPILGSSEDIISYAAPLLLQERTPIVVPAIIKTPEGPVRSLDVKIGYLVLGLNADSTQRWIGRSNRWQVHGDRYSDIGFHGNPWDSEDPLPWDFIRVHATTAGSLEMTSATAREPAYAGTWGRIDSHLTALLRRDLTDTRYADPNTFRRARLSAGAVAVFPLHLGGPNRHTCLHDFLTTSAERTSIRADIVSESSSEPVSY